MARFQALALSTKFWKPGTDAAAAVVEAVEGRLCYGDFVVVSEKALSTAQGRFVDEAVFEPSLTARVLAKVWMPIVWGYFLGVQCRFGQRLLCRIRQYPAEAGSRHKQVALWYAGISQALMFGSEGGIDGSNLPYSLVSLPLQNSQAAAEEIYETIRQRTGVAVTVVIVDTDKTYSFRNFHFTPRPKPMQGILSRGSIVSYVLGRWLKLRRRSTPLAVAGSGLSAEEALTVANVADRARGPGSGATVWDMAARFKVSTIAVTWEMLARVKHRPVVLVRKVKQTPQKRNCYD